MIVFNCSLRKERKISLGAKNSSTVCTSKFNVFFFFGYYCYESI